MSSNGSAPSKRRRAPRLVAGVVAAVAAFVALGCWAVSSPAGSAPDELYHLDSIWCGHGIDEDTCLEGPAETARLVPHQVATPACFTQNPAVSGSCLPEDRGSSMTPDASTEIGNWSSHGYPRVYYFVMSFLIFGSFDTSVIIIRLANCLLAVLLVGGVAWLAPPRLRNVVPLGFLATAVPLLVFTVSSANPSSWAVAAAGTAWFATYAAFEAEGRRKLALLGLMLLAAVMGSGARTDGAIFIAMGVVLGLGLRLSVLRAQWRVTLAALVTVLVCVGMYFTSGTGVVVTSGLGGYTRAPATDIVLLVSNVFAIPALWISTLGVGPLSGLGWFDTATPWVTGAGSTFSCAALIFLGWSSMWWNKVVALVLLGLALVCYPLVILMQSHIAVGNGVQPRYLLPMIVMLAGVSLLPKVGRRIHVNRSQAVILTIFLSAANSGALYVNTWRYVRGITGPFQSITEYDWWYGGIFPPPLVMWMIGSLAFAVTAWILLSRLVVAEVPEDLAVAPHDSTVERRADTPTSDSGDTEAAGTRASAPVAARPGA